jgi:hypothetical protein
MGETIKYFMWGYQPHFRIFQESLAERVFRNLDQSFCPEVFLVGVLSDQQENRFPACVEPEEDFWIHSEVFNKVFEIVDKFKAQYPESQIHQTHPNVQKWHDEHLMKRSLQDAIKEIVEAHPQKPNRMEYFVSYPSKVGSYLVCVVLGLQIDVLSFYPSLTKSEVSIHEYRKMQVPISLIDSTVKEFLENSKEELLKPDPGIDPGSSADADELIRSAGNRLIMGAAFKADQRRIVGWNNIFRACNTISSMYYEKSVGAGTIILAREDHPSLEKVVQFASMIPLNNYRGTRKLLELSSKGIALHSDSENIFGLAKIRDYSGDEEDLFEIRIINHHHWELRHNGKALMRVRYGQPYLPKLSFDEGKLRNDLKRIFNQITIEQVDNLIKIVGESEKEKHGTMLVITEVAAEEALRLSKQGIPLAPCRLTPELLTHFTPIDGALILSPDGICYAIGTILDGKATEEGDPARGARFNSAVRYKESSNSACLVVVISEDGGVDFIPDLRPAVRRSEIENAIIELKALSKGERINRRKYLQLMDWIEEKRFYLRQEHCDSVNKLIKEIEEKIKLQDPTCPRIIRKEFVPDPKMDESMYYEKEQPYTVLMH